MSNPALHHKINYIEFTTPDIERTKKFPYAHECFSAPNGWTRGASSNARGGRAPQLRFSGSRFHNGEPARILRA